MSKATRKRKFATGSAIIAKAGLSSENEIDAYNLLRSVILLQEKLDKHSMRIHEVRAEDIVRWTQRHH